MPRRQIDFMSKRWWLLGFSGVVVLICVAAVLFKGINFGIEFSGGTSVELPQLAGVSTEKITEALENAGMTAPIVQPRVEGGQANGWRVRSAISDTQKADAIVRKAAADLNIPMTSVQSRVIGPSYGKIVTDRAMLALVLSMAAILVYVSVRFEYKMSVTAIVAVLHDAVVVLGVYALSGRELTPNTIAALLTILGYSLYDTIVVFHRIRENTANISKQSFMSMANDSINQVFMRWVNTGLVALIPAMVLLFFGGETLKDFAFALMIGLISGAYSSVAVASPLYAMWKEREPRYQALKKKYAKA